MFFIYLSTGSLSWWQQDDNEVTDGKLDKFKHNSSGEKITAIIPVSECNSFTVDIAAKSDAQLMAAARFELEDELLDPVEDLHFAVKRGADGVNQAWVINHKRMRHWLAMLAENNINIDYLVPESALVRAANSGMTLWLEPERALMATDDNVVELDAIILEEYCRGLVDEEQTELISFIDPASLPEFLETDKFLKSQHPDTDFKLKIATAFDAFNTINLLQGEYKKPSLLLEKTKPWHPSAGLVLVMLVLLWVFLAVDNSKIKAQVASLNNQINQVYSSAFPGSRLVNSKLQMQDKLKNLAVKGNKQKDVSTLVSELGAVVQRASKLSLNELDFRGSLLRLSLVAKELDPLEELADKLKADGYNATLKSVRLVAGEVSANIEVRVR